MKIIKKVEGDKVDIVLDIVLPSNPAKDYVPKFVYNIVLHDTDTVVGKCDARIGANDNTFYGGNIGYGISKEHQNKGYATQAVKLLLTVFKANDINKIYISNSVDNIASQKVCQHIGAINMGRFVIPSTNGKPNQTEEYIWQVNI